MTKIVGTIRDVHSVGATSTLTIWSGFRATTVSVIAPRRRVWEVENGVLPDGIVVAPGPAVIQIDAGVSAFKSWPVEVPDQDEVTIQELLFQTVPWEPGTALPPPEEVADLLRLIADTSEQYRLALWADTDRALDQIALSVAMAQAVEVSGQEYSTAAQEHMAAALRYAMDSLAAAQEASEKAEDARGSLSATEMLRSEAESVRERIETLADQVEGSASEVDLSTAEGLAAAAEAARQAGIAAQLADQAQAIREQIERHMEAAQAAVAEGERQVARAMERADEAHQAVADAAGHADNAQGLVGDAQAVLESTQGARDEAQQSLEAIQGIGTEVDQMQTEVLSLHNDTIAKHAEVLTAQGAAIDAAADAAASAGEAAGLATDTAVHAANAAAEALSAAQTNAATQATFAQQQEQFNEDYAERVQLQAMMLEAVRDAQATSLAERWVLLTSHLDQGGGDDRVGIRPGTTDLTVEAHGTWVGRIVAQAGFLSNSGTGVEQRDWTVPQPDGSRVLSFRRPNSDGGRIWSRVEYKVDPAEQRVATTEVGRFVTTNGFVTLVPEHTFTAGAGGRDYAVTFTVRWPYANFLERFQASISLNGNMIGEFSKVNIGPLIGQAPRTRSVTVTGIEMKSGDQLTFYAGTSGSGDQLITDPSSTRVTWIQGG